MPSPSSIHEQLTDILVRVVDCRADAVVPSAALAELGTDSLTIVEVGEELGRRFGVRLSDAAIDSMVTVQDAIDAVVAQSAADRPTRTTTALASPPPPPARPAGASRARKTSYVATFVFFGLVIGGVLGLGGAALVSATGISKVDLPPIGGTPTPAATTPEPAEETTPTPASPTADPKPTINTSSEQVSPGERFLLSGAFPGSSDGEDLQVEVKDGGSGAAWDDFPIQTQVRDGGIFRTELYTSRTGERQFRVTNKATGESTPSITVTIG
ncbi:MULTISPECIES: acyl carrier protein [Aeromicrobium]|uniref:acyl carrier protein n=1 Tax=Aeromicrobium TaxID=2040 RepID=UPI0006FBBB0D|nr:MULTISPECIES: phosphopantetheine-binding protein [Aeromicrobium]KQX75349.1 hypothetical protein ASD10_09280 [Aeromicrobium sp. Root472D3]MCL8250141.1 phosphopantetheine-binding protein [Aeromicrobium fastidiosum]